MCGALSRIDSPHLGFVLREHESCTYFGPEGKKIIVKCIAYRIRTRVGLGCIETKLKRIFKRELMMSRRLDFAKDFRNRQGKCRFSMKDEAEWRENDAAARWLRRHANCSPQQVDHRPAANEERHMK